MKYINAAEILPEDLLEKLQLFVSGDLLYIPERITKAEWGKNTGVKKELRERNVMIRSDYDVGHNVDELADKYNLSTESIKKILYTANEKAKYSCSLESALEYGQGNNLYEWLQIYLSSDGNNKALAEGLKIFKRYYISPVMLPTPLLKRNCGPETDMMYYENEEWFYKRVNALKTKIKEGKSFPPIIVHYVNSEFELNDGNHRLEAYKELCIGTVPVILWVTEESELTELLDRYGEYLSNIRIQYK